MTNHSSKSGLATPPQISIATAAEWTANWRNQQPGKAQAQCFTLSEINQVASVQGAVSVRAYYGLEEIKSDEQNESEKDYKMKLFLVAVDANGNDILPLDGVLVDFARPCPSYCGISNILNSGLAQQE